MEDFDKYKVIFDQILKKAVPAYGGVDAVKGIVQGKGDKTQNDYIKSSGEWIKANALYIIAWVLVCLFTWLGFKTLAERG